MAQALFPSAAAILILFAAAAGARVVTADFLRLGAGLVQQIFDVCGPHFAFQNILPGSRC